MTIRVVNPFRGRIGGANGSAGSAELAYGTKLCSKKQQPSGNESRLKFDLPAGDSYGTQKDRHPTLAAADLREVLVTANPAKEDFGIEG